MPTVQLNAQRLTCSKSQPNVPGWKLIETKSIEANGLTSTADISGDASAPAVIALHGSPDSRHSWTALLEALAAAGLRGIAPDQRGYSAGARPSVISEYHVDHLVSDVLAVADAMHAPRFLLVGHDWGGQVAWLLAARHPQRLHSLAVLSRPHPAAFAEALESEQARRSRHHKKFQDPDMVARRDVPAITVPTMYLWASEDMNVGDAAATATARHVSADSRFEAIAGAGHFLPEQGPGTAAQCLLEHIRSTGETGAAAHSSCGEQ